MSRRRHRHGVPPGMDPRRVGWWCTDQDCGGLDGDGRQRRTHGAQRSEHRAGDPADRSGETVEVSKRANRVARRFELVDGIVLVGLVVPFPPSNRGGTASSVRVTPQEVRPANDRVGLPLLTEGKPRTSSTKTLSFGPGGDPDV